MRLRTFPLLFLLSAGAVRAQGPIHRCADANGNPVFTDRTCASLHATPVSPAAAAAAPPPLPSPVTLCAGSVDALKQGVVDAFAARDPNRLAALVLWSGYGRAAVVARIRALGELMGRPLLDVAAGAEGASDDGGAAPSSLAISVAAGDGTGQVHREVFGLAHRDGCLWLRPRD